MNEKDTDERYLRDVWEQCRVVVKRSNPALAALMGTAYLWEVDTDTARVEWLYQLHFDAACKSEFRHAVERAFEEVTLTPKELIYTHHPGSVAHVRGKLFQLIEDAAPVGNNDG